MAQFYRLILVNRRPEWFALDQASQERFTGAMSRSLQDVGGKRILMCNVRWSCEQWSGFSVTEYPSIDAVLKHTADMEELKHFRYHDVVSYLGTKV